MEMDDNNVFRLKTAARKRLKTDRVIILTRETHPEVFFEGWSP